MSTEIEPFYVPLADAVSEILEAHPAIPRARWTTLHIERAYKSLSNEPDMKAWAKAKYLIQAYAYLRVRGYMGAAAWVVVFNCGDMRCCRVSFECAEDLEKTAAYKWAFANELGQVTPEELWNPEIALKQIDRMTPQMKSARAITGLARERRFVLKAINKKQQHQTKE
jgi:hypothetical protein